MTAPYHLAPQGRDFALTTLAAAIAVSYHKISTVTYSASPIVPIDIKPTRDVDCYRCSGASSIRIFADDLRLGMVFIYLFSDTIARRDEEIDSATWSLQTQEKCGISRGSLLVVEGPTDKGAEFEEIINNNVRDMNHFIDENLREKTDLLPGRSFFVIHERNSHKFEHFPDGQRSAIILKKNGHLELEKDVFTGIYKMDIFG